MTDNTTHYNNKKQVQDAMDSISRDLGLGDRLDSYHNLLSGFNTRGSGNPVLNNKDHQGYVFFTRPMLNLTYSNLSRIPKYILFRDADPYSIQRAIRATLDPLSNNPYALELYNQGREGGFHNHHHGEDDSSYYLHCPLINRKSPFINVLSNALLNLTGWSDNVMDYYTSSEGRVGEVTSMANGIWDKNGAFSLEATFKHIAGGYIQLMFDLWGSYMQNVLLNKIQPYPEMLAYREYDYNTRIYRWVMDPTKRFVTQWCHTGASFHTNSPTGLTFNYDASRPLSDTNQTLSISFQSVGQVVNDPRSIHRFNFLVGCFDPDLRIIPSKNGVPSILPGSEHLNIVGKDRKVKIPHHLMMKLNNTNDILPLVNPYTMEMEWYADKVEFDEIISKGV